MMASRKLWFVGALALVPVLSGANDLEVASGWAAAPVKIDGTAEKWSALAKPVGDAPLIVGVQNDADYLYLFVKTSDQGSRMQIERAGLTVWVNAEGKTEKGFGVRFPVGNGRMGWQQGQPGQAGRPGQPGQRGSRGGTQGRQGSGEAQALAATPRPVEFELIGPAESNRARVPSAADQPFAVALGADPTATTVEFRIPLKATAGHPLAVGAAPGATIALGLSTERSWGARGQGRRGGEPQGQAAQAGAPTSAASQGTSAAAAAAGTDGGAGAAVQLGTPGQAASAAPAGAQAASTPAAPGDGQGSSSPVAPGFGRQGRRSGAAGRGGREMSNPLNVWVKVTLAQPPASGKSASAVPAPATTAKTTKAAPAAKATVAPTRTPVPAKTPVPPTT